MNNLNTYPNKDFTEMTQVLHVFLLILCLLPGVMAFSVNAVISTDGRVYGRRTGLVISMPNVGEVSPEFVILTELAGRLGLKAPPWPATFTRDGWLCVDARRYDYDRAQGLVIIKLGRQTLYLTPEFDCRTSDKLAHLLWLNPSDLNVVQVTLGHA